MKSLTLRMPCPPSYPQPSGRVGRCAGWLRSFLTHFALALTLTLTLADACAQAAEPCPNPKGFRLSQEELEAKLRAHQEWLARRPGSQAVLCNADLAKVDLRGKNLAGADLREANLAGAALQFANLAGAILHWANLTNTVLASANLTGADLQMATIADAQLDFANLTGTTYAPKGVPNSYVEGIIGLKTVVLPPYYDGREGVNVSALVQLRELLKAAGLRDPEREATYAIERNKTRHLLFAEQPPQLEEDDQSWVRTIRWRVEGIFRLAFFDWPVAYGLHPGRALLILLGSICFPFAAIYAGALTRSTGGIYRVWPADRLEREFGVVKLAGKAEVEPLLPWGFWATLGNALQFSLLSAFHLGWRELNVGSWIARVQAREYTLRAIGWVRVVSGIQSLLSVYLLAMWALTYFGRPFQ
jgi:hypothetical protein